MNKKLQNKYGLTYQSFLRWFELNIKGFVINNLIISLFLWVPYIIIYKLTETWWFKIALIIIPFTIFTTFISPLVIDPIFNEYTSIEDDRLCQQIEGLLSKAGVEDAVLSITAHAIGHYVKGHIWKNIIISSIVTFLILYLVYRSAT